MTGAQESVNKKDEEFPLEILIREGKQKLRDIFPEETRNIAPAALYAVASAFTSGALTDKGLRSAPHALYRQWKRGMPLGWEDIDVWEDLDEEMLEFYRKMLLGS